MAISLSRKKDPVMFRTFTFKPLAAPLLVLALASTSCSSFSDDKSTDQEQTTNSQIPDGLPTLIRGYSEVDSAQKSRCTDAMLSLLIWELNRKPGELGVQASMYTDVGRACAERN